MRTCCPYLYCFTKFEFSATCSQLCYLRPGRREGRGLDSQTSYIKGLLSGKCIHVGEFSFSSSAAQVRHTTIKDKGEERRPNPNPCFRSGQFRGNPHLCMGRGSKNGESEGAQNFFCFAPPMSHTNKGK